MSPTSSLGADGQLARHPHRATQCGNPVSAA